MGRKAALTSLGLILLFTGLTLGFYASQRNCLIAFITRGHMNFWTAIEVITGFIALIGIIILLITLLRKM